MRIAVSSSDYERVTGHAGRARRWLIFEVGPDSAPVEVDRVELPRDKVFHHHKDGAPSPIPGIDAVITAFAGEGFAGHLDKIGIRAVQTSESDPARAVAGFLAETLPPPAPRPVSGLLCEVIDRLTDHR